MKEAQRHTCTASHQMCLNGRPQAVPMNEFLGNRYKTAQHSFKRIPRRDHIRWSQHLVENFAKQWKLLQTYRRRLIVLEIDKHS